MAFCYSVDPRELKKQKTKKLLPLRKKRRCDFLQLIPTVRSHREEQKVGGPKVEVTHSALKMACGSWESHHVPPSPVHVAHGVSFTSSWASIGQPHKCCWVTSSWKRRNFKTYTTPWLCALERGSSHVSAPLRFHGGRWETFRRRKTSLLCCWNKKARLNGGREEGWVGPDPRCPTRQTPNPDHIIPSVRTWSADRVVWPPASLSSVRRRTNSRSTFYIKPD